MKRLLFVALIPALALAQDKRTEAEELFEKAWWEETAAGALDKALEGYRKAADATGSAAIRARSLYRAAIVEQRLGRTDAAVALLERLAKDFPGETELLKEAKTRLQEWTAVDLRKSFGEWYRSYVFSPEFQARVVDLVLRLGTAKQEDRNEVRSQLLTIGDAAAPALQEALKSSNSQLCHSATELLLDLGVVPPTEALVRYSSWVRNAEKGWLVIYGADEATRRRVREEAKGDEPLARALRAVATSPEEMLSFARAGSDARLVQRVLTLLMEHSGDAMRKATLALIREPDVSEAVTTYFMPGRFPQGPPDVELRDCLDWARSLPNVRARQLAATWAALKLTEKSEEDLDAVLALIPDPGDALVSDLAVPVLEALGQSWAGKPSLAWTSARAGMLIDLSIRLESAGKALNTGAQTGDRLSDALSRIFWTIRGEQRGAVAFGDALLDRAHELLRTSLMNLATGGGNVQIGGGTRDWRAIFAERAVARWPKLSLEGKVAVLSVTRTYGEQRAALKAALGDELAQVAVARDTPPALRRAAASFIGGVQVSRLLESFDLSTTEGARAAMDALEGASKSRDDRTAALMGEILIHGDSPTRRRALGLLGEWQSTGHPALLPVAKILAADEHAEVRLWAVNRLAEWNSFEASPYLSNALADADANVRATAAAGLARVGREDAVPALIKLLDDANPAVREAALAALEQIRKIVELKKTWQLEQAGFR
jgi:hypothetical protein